MKHSFRFLGQTGKFSTTLGVKLILTEIAREDYVSRAGFETVPFQLKNFTLGRINIYWLCVHKPLYLYLLTALETKNSILKLFSFPFQCHVNSPNLKPDDVFRVNWQNLKGTAVYF